MSLWSTFANGSHFCRKSTLLCSMRGMSSAVGTDVRAQLTTKVKQAMKDKDTFTSTTLRSILAEVQNADKAFNAKSNDSQIASILRKNVIRRVDSASQFTAASRADLAEKELREVELLETFLPPLLTELAVDETLKECITEAAISPSDNPGKSKGKLFKAFYDKVDKTLVDADLLKRRVDAILSQTATS